MPMNQDNATGFSLAALGQMDASTIDAAKTFIGCYDRLSNILLTSSMSGAPKTELEEQLKKAEPVYNLCKNVLAKTQDTIEAGTKAGRDLIDRLSS